MHWVAPSEKNTASATLEKRLWDTADQFRANSGLKAQEYSGPILSINFLRFAEVRFAAKRAQLDSPSPLGGERAGVRGDSSHPLPSDGRGAGGEGYLLLLMDELHVLLRESKNPRGVLADFRTDLNEVSNKISLLLADRYTLEESEKKIDSEYWLQLTPQSLDPLDVGSTKTAIEVPCQGTDIRFLPEAIDRVYFWTCGYPFHVQRLVQNVLGSNLEGPWVTVMPNDVDGAIPGLLEQDRLFQEGLCRRDRLDAELQAAASARSRRIGSGSSRSEPDWRSTHRARGRAAPGAEAALLTAWASLEKVNRASPHEEWRKWPVSGRSCGVCWSSLV